MYPKMCRASPMLLWHKIIGSIIPWERLASFWFRWDNRTQNTSFCVQEKFRTEMCHAVQAKMIFKYFVPNNLQSFWRKGCIFNKWCWKSYAFWSFQRWIWNKVLDLHIAISNPTAGTTSAEKVILPATVF